MCPLLLEDHAHAVTDGGVPIPATPRVVALLEWLRRACEESVTICCRSARTSRISVNAGTCVRKIDLCQPFHVAEHILGIPGETVEPAELLSEVSKRIGTTALAPTPSSGCVGS